MEEIPLSSRLEGHRGKWLFPEVSMANLTIRRPPHMVAGWQAPGKLSRKGPHADADNTFQQSK